MNGEEVGRMIGLRGCISGGGSGEAFVEIKDADAAVLRPRS